MSDLNERDSRIARLLRQANASEGVGEDTSSMRALTGEIEQFLAAASAAAPVVMEGASDTAADDDGDGGDGPAVCLSVVAGVLEERDPRAAGVAERDGLLLPTPQSQAALQRQQAREAQALLDLMQALSPHGGATGRSGDGSGNNSSSSSVAVMNAEDLDSSSSDDENSERRRRGDGSQQPFQRPRIEELS